MEMSFIDDLLNFDVPEKEDDEGEGGDMLSRRNITRRKTGLRQEDSSDLLNPDDPAEGEEEDLEWITNKDAFPVIDTFVGALTSDDFRAASPEQETAEVKQLSPVSVLETSSNSSTTTTTATTSNSSSGSNGSAPAAAATTIMSCCVGLNVPGKARSKRRRTGRRDFRVLWTVNNEQGPQKKKAPSVAAAAMGRKCQHCGAEKTPQWRAGPSGPKTLCNACGVRYKSGRLVPEYRPANSPTFSAELHSNSHRKIVEMRKQFQSGDGDRKDCG